MCQVSGDHETRRRAMLGCYANFLLGSSLNVEKGCRDGALIPKEFLFETVCFATGRKISQTKKV